MKLGIIGPESTAEVIRQVVEKNLPDIEMHFHCSEFYEESAESARLLQKEKIVDAILFTGPTNYAYASKRIPAIIPWSYLPHNRIAAMEIILRAISIYNSDLRAISVDRYSVDLLQNVLKGIGITDCKIVRPPYDAEEPGFEKKLLEFHRDCYRRGEVSICFTSMEHIVQPLMAEGIPCLRFFPSEEIVQEQIYHLRIMDLAAQENQGQLAVIAVRFDYTFDSEKNLAVREWEKMKYQNEFKENIYAISQQMEAAVFADGAEMYFIVTSRNMLINVFLKKREHWHLLRFGRRSPSYQAWMGIGLGSTMLEARSRATKALNQATSDRLGHSYMVESEHGAPSVLEYEDITGEEHTLTYLSQKLSMSVATLKNLARTVSEHGEEMTAEQLAGYMGLTLRSANRIVLRLEDEGFISVVGKQSHGKGRPARVLRVRLPDILQSEKGYH